MFFFTNVIIYCMSITLLFLYILFQFSFYFLVFFNRFKVLIFTAHWVRYLDETKADKNRSDRVISEFLSLFALNYRKKV